MSMLCAYSWNFFSGGYNSADESLNLLAEQANNLMDNGTPKKILQRYWVVKTLSCIVPL